MNVVRHRRAISGYFGVRRAGRFARAALSAAALGLLAFGSGASAGALQSGQKPPAASRVLIRAVGDVMMHGPQIRAGYVRESGAYSFRSWFEPVRDLITDADLALANLETVLAGRERRFTGYPTFNSPAEIAQALKWTGFDVLTTANNHSMDRGSSGVTATVSTLDKIGLAHTGTFASQRSRDTPLILNVKGVKIAVLAYTFSTNGIRVPQPYLVNRLSLGLVTKDAANARAAGAEVVIAAIHWGSEYQRKPNAAQQGQAPKIIAAGVDIIFGSHPHVVQPMEWITVGEGKNRRKGVVFYSLGNFVSNQRGKHKDEGIIAHVELVRSASGVVRIEKASYIPTYVERVGPSGKYKYRVLAVQRALETESANPALLKKLKSAWESTVGLMNSWKRGGSR
ncbi:MAG: CapA family protein [Armatimonadetes bacterium]|nr:CapA family protein [Armatimonadota bacterium]